MFKSVNPQVDFPKQEEEILEFWKKNKIFEKSLDKDAPNGKWTFLDGPPFITGLPHYGTLLVSIPKDVFPRFWTMRGYMVRRVWGWDVHGLPAENKVEVKLGIERKKDIEEKIGIKQFIDECRNYVSESSREWEWYIDHIARWVDFKNAYKTMDISYMESVMWVFKQMYEKGYIYKGLRVSLYCPHCSTPISNFEVAMDPDNYKEITEASNTYKYQLVESSDTYLLAWSTTPWNKLVTSALAVNSKLDYVKVEQGKEKYILAKSKIKILVGEYKIIQEISGIDLIGLSFVPHYDFYTIDSDKKAFIIVDGDFVTAEEGTGIVTIAAYGEEDLVVMQKENIQIMLHVDDEGMIKKEIPKWNGMYYLKVNKLVNEDLVNRGLMYKEEDYIHKIPTCWRCHTRLIYAPQNAWYVNVQILKDRMRKNNEEVNWFPKHFKMGRYLKSLESAPDWCISRSRYWGSPVPVWECECGERIVPGSIAELEEFSGKKITDLHKPEIDQITILCNKCKSITKRVPEVLDSWIEAGSASFAERHYPFNEKVKFADFFPPDFITEYTGQIRAWFYVLHVISTALYDSMAFKNVVVTGVILGTDGRKMSKNLGNYPDPKELLQKYGGDALRLYLMGSPVMHGEDMVISEDQYRNQIKNFLLVLWNIYNFFVSYALIDKWEPSNFSKDNLNILDKWILSKQQDLIMELTASLEEYDTMTAINKAKLFIDDFSMWYIRRSRERIGPSAKFILEKKSFYNTCYKVLTTLCKLLAPIAPFVTEAMYKNLTNEESVHLSNWPQYESLLRDKGLEEEMERARKIVERAHALRKEHSIKVRIPLRNLNYSGPFKLSEEIKLIVLDEINVLILNYLGKTNDYIVSGEMNEENQDIIAGKARDIIRSIQEERKKLGTRIDEEVDVVLPNWPIELESEIKRKALIKSLSKGDKLTVIRL
ncbi:isoleucine--tRNA ligase [Candidatus Levyibacteriota bacterium]|nr:isoleucine--tRNA ligase [Candidatus Levybacteria bacterium]